MSTKRLYREDVYARSNECRITNVSTLDGHDVITTDASVFFPEGGGQPSDIGKVTLLSCGANARENTPSNVQYRITSCYDNDLQGDVFHVTDAPAGTLAVGDVVMLELDWSWRFQNMQRHLGEHMLSGCLDNLFGGTNRGFHMGEDYITIDIDLGGRMLTDDELALAGRTVNEAIWKDMPVKVDWFDSYEASRSMPVRKDVPHDGPVSVVTVGADGEEPFDCIACCGTHPSSTGQVGIIAIYKLEANKGMNRIYFDCGMRAYEKFQGEHDMLTAIANRFSSGSDDLLHKLDIRDEREASMRDKIYALSQYAREHVLPELLSSMNEQYVQGKVALLQCPLFDVNELLKIGYELASEFNSDKQATCEANADKLLIMIDTESCTALLYGGSAVDCGKIIKTSASDFNGRGGGRPNSARAVFGSEQDMMAWIDNLRSDAQH